MTDLSTFLPTILASAFGGGLVAGGFGIYNRVASNKDEHDKWMRDQKIEAYATYLSAAHTLVVAISGFRGGQVTRDDTFAAFSAAQLGALELLAPIPVRTAAQELEKVCDRIFHAVFYDSSLDERDAFQSAMVDYNAKRSDLLARAQDDLKISRPENPKSGSELELQVG